MIADFIEMTRDTDYGPMPCAFWAAAGVRYETGFDPIEDLRGRDLGWAECRNMVIAAGGLLALVAPRMVHPSLTELDGDGAAVLKLGRQTLCGLIVDARAVVRMDRGIRVADDFTVLRGWSWRRP